MTPPVRGTFLASLNDGECESLYGLGVVRSYPPGAVLMFQGEVDDRTMILMAGRVKVARVEHDGRELMLDIRDPGDLLGELAFIDGGPRVATVTALEPVKALVTPAKALRGHLETTPRVAVVLLEIVAHRLRESSIRRSQFAVADTMGRLAARILDLADRYGEPSEDGIRLTTPLSQEDLAAWTGASRAGVAEALRVMRELGWVQTERRNIVVRDADALRDRAA
ncbi:MAG TPA: Crp/Fnr family transcriptional regulator [Solirubrobacteraceae bacterium]|nr:Crp/Fnr family transcriptional regulator [Solirubrobacteraceae bacterium]